jgi:hypothetical protein
MGMGSKRAACTIIAKNYFAAAKTLAQSFLSEHPDDEFYVLIVDEFDGFVDASKEEFEIIGLASLAIPDLPNLCFKYNIIELCTAVKAHFLQYLMAEKGFDKVLYIDPDILVTNKLEQIFQRLDTSDIILTSHTNVDYPDDGKSPDDSVIMSYGVFNLGFIGLNSSENAQEFLRWWQSKLRDKCVTDARTGYFVDQKFIDLVPGLFDNYYIEKNPGYNVAYWNIHSRSISRENGMWMCNDGPLYFFHFSSYRPERPNILARHTTRYQLSDRPDLQPLFAEYRERLTGNGYEQTSRWPYSHDFFDTGESIPAELKVLYKSRPEEWHDIGDPFKSKIMKRRAAMSKKLTQKTPYSRLLSFAYWSSVPIREAYKRWLGAESISKL